MSFDLPASYGSADDAPSRPAGERFPRVRWREGYAIDEVDAFFDTIASRTADDVRKVRFGTKKLSAGYDMHAVDDSLDRWAAHLDARR